MPTRNATPGASAEMHATAAVIAAKNQAPAIAATLRAHGLPTVTRERIDEVDGGSFEQTPSVIVLWVRTPSAALSSSLASLTKRLEGTPVVVVCESMPRWALRGVLTHGAAGIVLGEEIESALIPCVRAVLAGQACVPGSHRQQIEPPALSSREKQILGLVVMGYMNGQIAEQLFLAESTIKSHLSSAFRKLGVRSRNEAVKLILDRDSGFGVGILALGSDLQTGGARSDQPSLAAVG